MSENIEPTEFRYANNSLTTIGEARLLQRLGSYFKLGNKLRDYLDTELLKDNRIIRVACEALPLNETFCVANLAICANWFFSERNIERSAFMTAYALYQSNAVQADTFVIHHNPPKSNSALFVLTDLRQLDISDVKGGGIYMNYPPDLPQHALLPVNTYLAAKYPLPTP